MKYHKNVPRAIRDLLETQLKEYECSMKMNAAERKSLHEWVAFGNSPYRTKKRVEALRCREQLGAEE